MPGVHSNACMATLVEQIVESVRRVEFVTRISGRPVAASRADPSNATMFDPVRGAIWHRGAGDDEEAAWLTFLFVHFGKHRRGGWRYLREAYAGVGGGSPWDWSTVSSDGAAAFCAWIRANASTLSRPGAGFGPHRKYESFSSTADVIESYVKWVSTNHSHRQLISDALANEGSPEAAFARLFNSMDCVLRFGRLAKFDYLCMLKKLGLASINPGHPFLTGSSGPLQGARLLFGVNEPPTVLDQWVAQLGAALQVDMQVMEDSLCNWQKSPDKFEPFRG
ncbi:MAG: hypothetical protein KDC95_15060 [Planctomycetes bacterium]|nr:hypothetical protein [Planctomycetota bacterium]